MYEYARSVQPIPVHAAAFNAAPPHPQAKANKLQTLCSFLPAIVLRKLSCLTREEASAMRPSREDFHACAVVMLDMWVCCS